MVKQIEYVDITKGMRNILGKENPDKIFLVTGASSYKMSSAKGILDEVLKKYEVRYFIASPNPKISTILQGIKKFNEGLVIAVGGGSTIDTAKLINILSAQDADPVLYITGKREIKNKGSPLVAIPTTAGSGSEATHFAVVYLHGNKYSVAHKSILPTYSIVDYSLTLSMPKEVAAATGMDALSHAIESYWSTQSTHKSKSYSEKAIELILNNLQNSVNNCSADSRKLMSIAANLAGKAINISKTTAAHALSYTITSNFGIPHGHAVALTLGKILEFNAGVTYDDCNDKRGKDYVDRVMSNLVKMLGCSTAHEANLAIKDIMKSIGLETSFTKLGIGAGDLIKNVNYERLANNPRKLDKKTLGRVDWVD